MAGRNKGVNEVPEDEKEWQSLVESMNLGRISLHTGIYTNSASGISVQQFLLLRVLSKKSKASELDILKYVDAKWVKAAKEYLRNEETGWKEYLASIEKSPKQAGPRENLRPLGVYCSVKDLQLTLFDIAKQPPLPAQIKVEFSPGRARAGAADEAAPAKATKLAAGTAIAGASSQGMPYRPKTPDNPSIKRRPGPVRGPSRDDEASGDEIGAEEEEEEEEKAAEEQMMLSVELSPYSPARKAPPLPLMDEQLVNMALIVFLRALIVHYDVDGEWSPARRAFTVNSGGDADGEKTKIYEARVDGYLRRSRDDGGSNSKNNDNVRAIVEVKPNIRYQSPGVTKAIKMQEGAQMAAWICHHPPAELETCRRDGRSMTRFLVSQDCYEIYLTFAVFDAAYVDYIQGKPTPAPLSPFLEMREFGPFSVSNRNQMQVLSEILLAFTMQQCQ